MQQRRASSWIVLSLCGALLAACGGFRAPILGSPSDAVTAPVNPQMGQVVNGAYFVAPGDTLATISTRTNTPIRALIDNNDLQPPYNLRAGQELRISERQTYTVQSGDTLSGLAKRFQVSQSALVDLNNLTPPYLLRVGQSLTLPSTLEAPQQTMAAQQPISAAPAGEIDAAPLPPVGSSAAATAGSTTSTPAGAKPFTPDPVASSPTAAPTSTPTAPSVNNVSAPAEPDLTAAEEAAERAYEEAQKQKQAQQAPAPAPAAVETAPAEVASAAPVIGPASAAGFSWPVQGKVIAKFGATADGLRNDGINISAPAGAPVMAAADGTVAYAGNQLRGFGNLILVRHANGLITAYAHNQSFLVQKGDKVKRGDVIARVGSTGNVDKPQLHFEIRKGEEAVDPMKYLAGGA
jgi:murein DD-endopeptidase MepM/ murein hydrolase activator NlpD